MSEFIGRHDELRKLNALFNLNKAKIAVVKGRRRVGKSYLVKEFAKDKNFIHFSGIAPVENICAQDQRDTFSTQLALNFNTEPQQFTDWYTAFVALAVLIPKDKKTVLLFDEISWMGSEDPTFIPKLKNLWDLILQDYPNLVFVFCGSVSTWIEENIINSTAFFGRISAYITLQELSLPESALLLKTKGCRQSIYDTYKLLSVTGGIPWYLEQVDPTLSVDDNIKKLCFDPDGLLVQEFDRIFYDLFVGEGPIYKRIVNLLGEGMKDQATIRTNLDYPTGGVLGQYLQTLIISGYVDQHYGWALISGKIGRQSLYRLSDNYLRFYIKYIEPNLKKIKKGSFQHFSLSNLPGWETMMGFQVENLLLNNRTLLLQAIGIQPHDIVADNPYIQRTSNRRKGCQIDYLIQTHMQNLFVCEFKFSRRELGSQIIESMKDKLKRFVVPRRFGVSPVLVHLSGVSDTVHDARYFYRIVDMADLLEGSMA